MILDLLHGVAVAPGWCAGPLLLLSEAGPGGPLPVRRTCVFPPYTRAGLVEEAEFDGHGRRTGADLPAGGFVAAVPRASAAQVLNLYRCGALGFVVEAAEAEIGRHGAALARALGLPMLAGVSVPSDADGLPVMVDATGRLGWVGPAVGQKVGRRSSSAALGVSLGWPGRRVLPLPMLSEPSDVHLELVTAHAEERLLARDALDKGLARGIGLLRLELILMASPGIEGPELTSHLEAVLGEFEDVSVAIRLADWGDDKVPNASSELFGWSGQRGIAGLLGTAALEAQVEAVRLARVATGHADVWLVAPYVEHGFQMRALRALVGEPGVRLGAMVESERGCDEITTISTEADGVWFGLGDLSTELGAEGACTRVIAACEGVALAVSVCGELRPRPLTCPRGLE
jgi:signal transduction protein with GAF and PtsI domain